MPSRVAAIPGIDLKAKRIPSRYLPDREYERAWAAEIMGVIARRVAAPQAAHRSISSGRPHSHFSIPLNELLAERRTAQAWRRRATRRCISQSN